MMYEVYEKPREKLARKGVASLTNTELLQVIIGSGNAQVSVAKIAKKVAKVLDKSGSSVHPQELLSIQGMGIVKAGQVLALFELAARFPVLQKGRLFDSKHSLKVLYEELSSASIQSMVYVTFDGSGRVISKRQTVISESTVVSKHVRRVFADCIADSAASIFFAIGWKGQGLDPLLHELRLVRDSYKTAQLLAIPIRSFVLVSDTGERDMKDSVA